MTPEGPLSCKDSRIDTDIELGIDTDNNLARQFYWYYH